MVSQTMIKALNSVQAQLVKIPGLTDDQVEQIQAIITKNTQPKIKGTGKKTGYILFSMTERRRLKDAGELEGLAFGDVARLLGKNWRESDQNIKDRWNDEAKSQNLEPPKEAKPVKKEAKKEAKPAPAKHHYDSDTDIEEDVQPVKAKRGRKPKKVKKAISESDSEY